MTQTPSFRRSRDLDKSNKFRQMQELTNDNYSEISNIVYPQFILNINNHVDIVSCLHGHCHRVPNQSGNQGKPGKRVLLFLVREKSWNLRKNAFKPEENQGILFAQ